MPIVEELIRTKPIQDPYHRSLVNILYNNTWLLGKISQILKSFGITEPQFNVLRILRGSQDQAMNLYEIQARMIQKMSNVSRLVDKLEEKKYVVREACDDNRRRVNINITPKGLDVLAQIDGPFNNIYAEMSATLSYEEAQQLSILLDKVRFE